MSELKELEERLVNLITEVSASLHREMQGLEKKFDQRFDRLEAKFELQSTRLDRQGALIQNGPAG